MGQEILGDGVGHREHRALAGGVGEPVGNGALRHGGRHVEDHATAVCRHVPQRGLAAVRHPVHVHPLDAGEVLGRCGEGVADVRDAGVVHEDVHAAPPREDAGERRVDGGRVAHVAALALRVVSGAVELGHGGGERRLLQVDDLDDGMVGGEPAGDGETDPGGAPGDDGGLSGEIEGATCHDDFPSWFGMRPIIGYCSASNTVPLIGRLTGLTQ